jgi:aldose sugar dehydrogenase
MRKLYLLLLLASTTTILCAQPNFFRSELPTQLNVPWEIVYGPDNFLWVTDSGGRISRINPDNGDRLVVYEAPDYFAGSPQEQLLLCFQPNIGSGTLGMALHPNFLDTATSYIYFLYSYNHGTVASPQTRFKVRRIKWDAASENVTGSMDIITGISNGYDHLGGRLLIVTQGAIPYLFVSVGDHGISETNSPDCYDPQTGNPNNFAQVPTTDNGKIHRFHLDGSIPADNPLPGNSFYTRGHRNPQGLMYNSDLDIIYDIEHGDRTDDEINILYKGMNYGWKYVRGYHADNNFPGEASYIANYAPYPGITNDSLVQAFYSWCATTPDTSSNFLDWCTVAPSDGMHYNSSGIPEWTNSLLVVTLKNGLTTDNEVFQFQLLPNGELEPSMPNDPNPKTFFGADQALNGRLRDIAASADGKKIFLINNGGAGITDKITVYTYDSTATAVQDLSDGGVRFYPNPADDIITLQSEDPVITMWIYDLSGRMLMTMEGNNIVSMDVSQLAKGPYVFKLKTHSGNEVINRFVKH